MSLTSLSSSSSSTSGTQDAPLLPIIQKVGLWGFYNNNSKALNPHFRELGALSLNWELKEIALKLGY
jgi:hypothetical protein